MAKSIPEGKYFEASPTLTIHYHDLGQGPAVMFIHGSGPGASGWSNFKANKDYFVAQGYRVLLPDLVGYGLSSKPSDAQYTLDFFIDPLEKLLKHLNINQVTLVGNSLGGAIAMQMALNQPQLVDKLILMAPGGLEERDVYFQMAGIAKMSELFAKGPLDFDLMKSLLALQVVDASIVSDETIAERVAVCATQPKEVLSTMKVPNMSSELPHIQQPILGFWGINDQFTPHTGAEKILKNCPNSRFVMLNQCGHWVMVEHRDVFNRYCIDFLKNN